MCRHSTPAEKTLWNALISSPLHSRKFRGQAPAGLFVADLFCPDVSLIVEIDGATHSHQIDDDADGDAWLRSRGYRVTCFWNNDVPLNLDDVLQAIALGISVAATPPPVPLPQGEGEKKD